MYLGGFGLWLVAFSISTAAIFRFAQQVTQRGVSNAAWSAFYNVVPRERRAQVLAFNDGVPGEVGTILSGLLLLAAGSLFARDQVFWLGALTALLCTLVVAGIRRRYGASVLDSLRAGLGEQVLEGGPGLGALTRDPTATDTLIGALRSDEPGVRRMAADLLGRTSVERAGPVLIRTVDDDADPSVRAAALEALGRLGGPPPAMAAAVSCLADPDPGVRAAAIRAVGALSADPMATLETLPLVDELIVDPDPEVRAAIACLFGADGPDPRSATIIDDLMSGPGAPERIAGLGAIRRLGEPVPVERVSGCLHDASSAVRVAAIQALAVASDTERTDPALLAALDDDAAVVRTAAATALLGAGRGTGRAPGPARDRVRTDPGRCPPSAPWPRSRGPPAGHRLDPRPAGPGDRPPPSAPHARDGHRAGTRSRHRLPQRRPVAGRAPLDRPEPGRPGRPRRHRGRRDHPALHRVGRPGGPGAGDRGARLDR